MTDAPKTAMQAMMLSAEDRRLEARDRAAAISIGRQMVERFFKPDAVEDMRDVRRQITNAAENAAYLAIQEERKLHAGLLASLPMAHERLRGLVETMWPETRSDSD